MRRRSIGSLLLVIALAACGGNGATPLVGPHTTPPQPAPQRVTFRLKVPPARQQVRRKHWIRGKYVSPATLGVGISYWTSTPVTQDRTPQIAFDLATCLAADGCTSSTSSGATTYTLTAAVPAGTYGFDVTTWDASPTGTLPSAGVFANTANALSEGAIASQTISPGTTPTLSLTLNGVPATLSLVPRPDQTHVAQITSGYQIVGSAPVQFLLNAVDADGYTIVGSGAPVVSFSNAAGDLEFTCPSASNGICSSIDLSAATAGTPNLVNVQAVAYSDANPISPVALSSSDGSNPTLRTTATVSITEIPELWVSFVGGAGTCPCGLFGYPMAKSNGYVPTTFNPIDATLTTNLANNAVAIDATGAPWLAVQPNASYSVSGIDALTAPSGTVPPQLPANFGSTTTLTLPGGTASQADGMAIDGNDLLWVADSQYRSGSGEIVSYLIANGSDTPTTYPSVNRSFIIPYGIAAAPPSSSVGGSIWVAASNGIYVKPVGGSSFIAAGGPGSADSVGIGPGDLAWVCTGAPNLSVYAITGSASAPTLGSTPLASTSSVNCEQQMAVLQAPDLPATTNSIAFMGNGFGIAGITEFAYNSSTGAIAATQLLPFPSPQNANASGVAVAP